MNKTETDNLKSGDSSVDMPNQEEASSSKNSSAKKPRSRKGLYFIGIFTVIFCLWLGYLYFPLGKKNQVVKQIKSLINVSIHYSEVITGNKKVDKFLLETKITALFVKPFRKISLIHISSNKVIQELLSDLQVFETLHKLYITDANITDITPLSGLQNITYLRLDNNQITDLSPLYGLTSTHYIDVSNNPNLTIAEVNKLKKALPNCYIEHNAKK